MTVHRALKSSSAVFEQSMTAWHTYWQANPRAVSDWQPFPFLIFRPSFANSYLNRFEPRIWTRTRRPASLLHRCRQCLCSRTVKRMRRDLVVTNPETSMPMCIERTERVSRHYERGGSLQTKMNTDIGPPSFPSTAARPPRANSKPSSKPSSNPPARSPDVSTGQADIPEAAVTTIRGNQSRNIRRELRCRGSMVMIPSTSGSYSVPCPLPKIRTKMFVSIGPRECVVTVELDSNAVLTSLLASCELVNELVRLSYERVLVVDRLQELAPCVLNPADSIKSISRSMEQMPLDDAAENEDEDDCEYEVTTRVEHTFRFPTAFYVLEAIRVKQMESVVYIHVPRSDINVVSK